MSPVYPLPTNHQDYTDVISASIINDIATQVNTNTNAQPISVKAYGAKGDGVTNDTSAVQAAITAAGSTGVVFFPPGTYVANIVASHINGLCGAGASSIIAPPSGVAISLSNVDHAHVSDLAISGGTIGVLKTSGGGCWFERLTIYNQTTAGIQIQADAGIEDHFVECHVYSSSGTMASGIEVVRTTSTDVGALYFNNIRVISQSGGAVTTGYNFHSSVASTAMPIFMSECVADGSTTNALIAQNIGDMYVTGSWFTSLNYAIALNATQSVFFTACLIIGATGNFDFSNTAKITGIVGCQIPGGGVGGSGIVLHLPGSNKPTNIFLANNNIGSATLTNDYPGLGLAVGQTHASLPVFLTRGDQGAAQCIAIQNMDGASKLSKFIRVAADGTLAILSNAFGMLLTLSDTGQLVLWGGGLVSSGNITWGSDNANDIGAAGIGRPRHIYTGGNVYASGGVAVKVKAGVPVDGDFTGPIDGMLAVDSTDNKIYVRIGGTWKGVVVA